MKRKTKAESEWIERAVALGCAVCKMPAEYHHRLGGKGLGQKASHFDGFPLCPFHHRLGGHGFAIHAGIVTWELRHGTEEQHIERIRGLLM